MTPLRKDRIARPHSVSKPVSRERWLGCLKAMELCALVVGEGFGVPVAKAEQGRAARGNKTPLRDARVHGREVIRTRSDGWMDWATVHLTKRGARRAADLYIRTGQIKGRRP